MIELVCFKILAIGSNKRFAWFLLPNGDEYCVRVSDKLYYDLKKCGVPTSQSLRRKK